MKGDFTRITFDPSKHYSLVFEQQGRVQLDSDANEMNIIHLYFSRILAADLIGPHGGSGDSFKIVPAKNDDGTDVANDFAISGGHYYVNGILCENGSLRYSTQRGSPDNLKLDPGKQYLAYLDVWDRHITAYEDEDEERIGIREVALRGPDTATRAQIVWQVKWRLIENQPTDDLLPTKPDAYKTFLKFLGEAERVSGRLRARSLKPKADDEPCIISPEARYRGAENQLYRVEIHHPGVAMPNDTTNLKIDGTKIATFKWSRENGSVIFPITSRQGEVVTLRDLGRESRFGLRPDDWVEIVDDDYTLQNRAEPLLQIKEIDRDTMEVTLKTAPGSAVGTDSGKHPLLRRWDQRSDAIAVVETSGDDDTNWIFTLEDGVQVQFISANDLTSGARPVGGKIPTLPTTRASGIYRTGDYWLIPARVATRDVEWPGPPGNPRPAQPLGIQHSFAPLGIISGTGGSIKLDNDLRKTFKPLT